MKEKTNKQEKKSFNKQELFRALKFLGFSISAGVIQIVSFEILFDAIKWLWWPSYLISIVLSVIWNFTFNRKFTFKSANNVPIAMMWTLLYYVAFIPVSVFGGDALEGVGWNGTLVTVIMMVINFVTEFLWQRFFVFRNSIDSASKPKIVEVELSAKEFNNLKNCEDNAALQMFCAQRDDINKGDTIIFKNKSKKSEQFALKVESMKKISLAQASKARGFVLKGKDLTLPASSKVKFIAIAYNETDKEDVK